MAKRLLNSWLIAAILLFGLPASVQAVPPQPYGPYGTAKINDAYVLDGTFVRAYCHDVEYGIGQTLFAAGASRYSISVRGDDPETGPVDGCLAGETVVFTVGGWTADQTGTWIEGYSEPINLTALRPEPALIVEKSTQGADADSAPGPNIRVGDTVTWTYTVTNTGNVALTNVTVTDDMLGAISCPQTTLAIEQTITCTHSGSAQGGQYANVATVTADYDSTTVEDSDPSHYFGQDPSIDIEKATNGQDADTAPGVFIPANQSVTWNFSVTNTGNVDLTGVAVSDNVLGAVTCPETSLAVDESMICTVNGTTTAGQHVNTATATGTPPLGPDVSDLDSSHYFGAEPGIDMDKLTQGVDADIAPGPYARVGQTVNWSYVVTNTGNITLTVVSVTDDQGVTVDCPTSPLAATDSLLCTASAPIVEGTYTNLGTVSATPLAGNVVTATDRSHYFGIAPAIVVEKATNGVDADTGTGPLIRVGDAVTWTFAVTNTGNITLTDVTLLDTLEGQITCPKTILGSDEGMLCTASSTAAKGQYTNSATVTGTPPVGAVVSDDDLSHYFGADPVITVEKNTNGQDADTQPGPFIVAGDTVTWSFVITNTGNVNLTSITLVDNQEGAVTGACPSTDLDVGLDMTCIVTSPAIAGQYANTVTVTATPPVGSVVIDTDSSHYFGITPSLIVEKWTNGDDADTSPGPYIRVGDSVTWTYMITNTGNITLTGVTPVDDPIVSISCPKSTLIVDEGMQCEAVGTAFAGQYRNDVLVTAVPPVGPSVTATDASHYFGVDPSILIEKSTNGQDADSGTGPIILVGDTVTWTYWVSNTGNSPLTAVQVSDNQLGLIDCPLTSLDTDESMVCEVTGSAAKGQYSNTAVATGTPLAGPDVSDNDPSHYYGGDPSIQVLKVTNGEIAGNPPGPYILVGDVVTWTYIVTNTGNIELDSINLIDDQGVTISCSKTVLVADEVMTCSAVGTAVEDQYVNNVIAYGTAVVGEPVSGNALSHYFGANPGITITKLTKGLDISSPPGPILPASTTVTWTYAVSNTGNVTLTAVTVADDQNVLVTCPQTTLALDEGMLCSAEDVAIPGQYTNIGTASGQPPEPLAPVAVNDTSHYFAFTPNPSINLRKAVNGSDANTAPGIFVEAGSTVTWTYEIANTGNITVNNVIITDDLGTPGYSVDDVVVCSIAELGLYTTQLCTLVDIVISDQYVNEAIASGLPEVGSLVTDTDMSFYFGTAPFMVMEKHTNGLDADSAPGPLVLAGDSVTWTFAVTNTGNVTLTAVTLSDDVLGTVSCPKTILAPDEPMLCITTNTATAGQYTNTGTVTGIPPVGGVVSDSDPSHYFGVASSIDVEKTTNGVDADTQPGPFILAGDTVTWTYTVTNTGNVTLTAVTLSDDVLGTVSCPKVTLAPDESMLCTASGTATAGQYTNTVTGSGTPPVGNAVSDSDPSHYFGAVPVITLEKATNGQDADTQTGPFILVGDAVTWTYAVTNTGNVTLTAITLSDDVLGTVNCPTSDLVPDESMSCTASGTATVGQYTNTGTVSGTPPVGAAVSDSDPSHYFGAVPVITLEKATNGQDADTQTGPFILVGDAVTWTYTVTNTGNVTLTAVTLSDDVLGTVSCPKVTLAPDESMLCTASGTATAGQYTNTGTGSGTPPVGNAVSDSDPSHYFGAVPVITLEKVTNGQDADTQTGPFILVGDAVTWTYAVTNTGNVTLTAITLSDDDLGTVSCPKVILAPDESMSCTATGTATSGQYANTGTVLGTPPVGDAVSDNDPSHYFGIGPGIIVEKTTNGQDADTLPGPFILAGNPVTWTYSVTNTGNVTLTAVTLSDDVLGIVSCPKTILAPDEPMSCITTSTTTPGQYTNTGTVSGTPPVGAAVSDSDPSHYFGAAPAIDVEKSTNGQDADTEPGTFILAGDAVTWTYAVTNTGNVTLTAITLSDDVLGTVNCPTSDLAPDESMSCTAIGTASAGQYANTGTVSGTPPVGAAVSDSDPSHYFGAAPAIDVEKSTNGQDADAQPGPLILAGDPVTWTYDVTNIGNATLTAITLSDDVLGTVSCPKVILAPDDSMSCTASDMASAGQYVNTGTVSGTPPVGAAVSDSDPSHYYGVTSSIKVEKFTNGQDADAQPGPFILVGDTVTWTYEITNTGNVTLTAVTLSDDVLGTVSCPKVILAPGALMSCTASGTATAGQYVNTGTVIGTPPAGDAVRDSDPSHYFGVGPSIKVEKSTNGQDADTLPGPFILVGDSVTWTYDVTNTGNVTLTAITLSDDVLGTVSCPKVILAPDDSMSCTASGTATAGQYVNTGTVSGTPPAGDAVRDSDPSHYFGVLPGIDIEKTVSRDSIQWYDADTEGTALQVTTGSTLWWRIAVTNTSNTTLSVTINDHRDGQTLDLSASCSPPPPHTMTGGTSYACVYSGIANKMPGVYTNVASAEGYLGTELVGADTDTTNYVINLLMVYLPFVLR